MSELQELLDQHDYKSPQVGDIRPGIIVAISPQGVIVDMGLKRDGLVPPSDLAKLEPEERDALQVDDELFVYVLNIDKPDSLSRIHQFGSPQSGLDQSRRDVGKRRNQLKLK